MRRHWVALLVAVVVLILLIALVKTIRQKQAVAGGPGGARYAQNGPVAVSVATAASGDIQLRIPALGTVTPLATVTVRTQISGDHAKDSVYRGPNRTPGRHSGADRPRPYEAALQQMKGNLQRDKALLADAELDLKRYEGLVKEDSIAQQQLDTQRALVDQYKGTIESDEGQVKTAAVNLLFTHITSPITGRVGLAPGRSGQLCHARRCERHRRHQPAATHHRHLPHPRGQCSRPDAAPASTAARCRWRPTTGPTAPSSRTASCSRRQSNRRDDGYGQAARAVRERRRPAVPEPIRQHPTASGSGARIRSSFPTPRCAAALPTAW